MTDNAERSRPDPAQGPAHDVPKFEDLVEGQRVCMMTTFDDDGSLISRPMAVQAVEGSTVWFFSFADAPKLDQLAVRPRVGLVFADGGRWVSASGSARLVDDAAKKDELWNPYARAWFQAEPDDSSVALLRIDLEAGEYWDEPSKPAQLIGLAAALIGNAKPADGGNAKLDLD